MAAPQDSRKTVSKTDSSIIRRDAPDSNVLFPDRSGQTAEVRAYSTTGVIAKLTQPRAPARKLAQCAARPCREEELVMKRIVTFVTVILVGLVIGFAVAITAAGKPYQFTGTVKSNDGGVLTVEKTPKDVWTFSTDKDTKGTAKAGDKVTVYYKMIATEIESKPATPAKKTK
jgi:hypothetical protein